MAPRPVLLGLALIASLAPSIAAANPNGVWTPLDPPARQSFSMVRDAVRNRIVLFGGYRSSGVIYNDVWSLSLAGPGMWRIERPLGTPPSARSDQTTVYDSRRGRMIVFGGFGVGGDRNDLWSLDLGAMTWSLLVPQGTLPSPREYASAVYDSLRDRMLLFGGAAGGGLPTDLWELSFAGTPTWTQLAPAGPVPPGRAGAAVIIDTLRDRLVMFGGNGPYAGNDQGTWALNLSGAPQWQEISTTGTPPEGLYGTGGIYDPIGDRLVTIDWYGNSPPCALTFGNPSAWSRISLASPADPAPPPRYVNGMVYDPTNRGLVIYGGYANESYDDAWSFSLATRKWTKLAPVGPDLPGRHNHTATLDPGGGRVIVFGGQDPFDRNDAWALQLGATPVWKNLQPTGTPPGQVYGVAAAFDTRRNRVLYFGGYGTFLGLTNAVSQLDLSGTPAWSVLATAGTPPSPRQGATGIYDPAGDRFVIFGGLNYDNGTQVFEEVWSLSLSGTPTWTRWTPGAGPSGRAWASSAFDAARNRMLVFGGFNYSYINQQNDVWALSLGNTPGWTPIVPAGGPPPGRYYAMAVIDPARDRLLIHGGGYADTWALNLAGPPMWTELQPAPPGPDVRHGSAGVFDPVGDRMIEIGGSGSNDELGDSWALAFGDGPVPTLLSLADIQTEPGHVTLRWQSSNATSLMATVERSVDGSDWAAIGVPRLEGKEFLVYEDRDVSSGRYAYRLDYQDGSVRRTSEPVFVDVKFAVALSLGGFRPNPAAGSWEIVFSLPDAAPARLEIVDVRGRLIFAREVGGMGAGPHHVGLDGSERPAPGIYWLRLLRAGESRIRKGIVVG